MSKSSKHLTDEEERLCRNCGLNPFWMGLLKEYSARENTPLKRFARELLDEEESHKAYLSKAKEFLDRRRSLLKEMGPEDRQEAMGLMMEMLRRKSTLDEEFQIEMIEEVDPIPEFPVSSPDWSSPYQNIPRSVMYMSEDDYNSLKNFRFPASLAEHDHGVEFPREDEE